MTTCNILIQDRFHANADRIDQVGLHGKIGGQDVHATSTCLQLVLVPTWFAANWWLQSFACRIPINPLVVLMGGVSAIVMAWITVSYQSLKATSTDPVSSLRYE